MNDQPLCYGNLCSIFYDATKAYAPEAEVAFYASFIEKNPGRVLEAMSGSGRLQIPLIQRGYTVDGVDNSTIMLNRCRQRCSELGLAPELYEQSLEDFKVPHLYTTVTIAVSSFQLIVEQEKALQALKNIRNHMVADGILLIDIFTPDRTVDPRSIRIARLDHRQTIRLTTRYVFDELLCRADAFCLYELLVEGFVVNQENEYMQLTWRTDAEWTALLREAGFEVVAFHDVTFRVSGPSRVIQARAVIG